MEKYLKAVSKSLVLGILTLNYRTDKRKNIRNTGSRIFVSVAKSSIKGVVNRMKGKVRFHYFCSILFDKLHFKFRHHLLVL